MNENRRKILEMLSAGKLTADEADRLLAALEPDTAQSARVYAGNAPAATSAHRAARRTVMSLTERARTRSPASRRLNQGRVAVSNTRPGTTP